MTSSVFPKISLITPSYNQAEFLEATIRSVLSQEYPNLEYIVIDGGSTDGSVEILEKYSDQLTYWHSQPDDGQSDAINQGMNQATGDILGWINSDDVLRPGSLHLVGSVFHTFSDISWITGLPNTITADGYAQYMARPPWYVRSFLQRGWYHRKLLGFVMQEGSFWRSDLWKKVGSKIDVSLRYSMDYDLWKKFAQYSELTLVNTCLASYRLNPHRKNNDDHAEYYAEIGSHTAEWLYWPAKYLWRQIVQVAHRLKIPPLVYYSLESDTWQYRRSRSEVESFQLFRE